MAGAAQAPTPTSALPEKLAAIEQIVAPDSGWTAGQLRDLAYELLSTDSGEFVGVPKGQLLERVVDAIAARGGVDDLDAYLDSLTLHQLCREPEMARAQAFAERAMARAPERHVCTGALQTEVAEMLRMQRRYGQALERVALAREQLRDVESGESEDPFGRVLLCVLHGVTAECYLGLGLPDIADEFIAKEDVLSSALADRHLRQGYHDRRMKRLRAVEDHHALLAAVEAARSDPLLAETKPSYSAKLALRALAARVDLERDGPGPFTSLDSYRALRDDGSLEFRDRREVFLHGALAALDRDERATCREAIGVLDEEVLSSNQPGPEVNIELDACLRAMEFELSRRDAAADQAQRLAAQRRTYVDFLRWWRSSPERVGGVGFLAYSRRRFVLESIVQAEVASDPVEGPARALAAVALAQESGSLTRFLAAPAFELERHRARFANPDELILSYFAGRSRVHVLALSTSGVRHFELGTPEALHSARTELETRLAEAVRRLATWSDPELQAALAPLRELLLPQALCELLRASRSVVVIGLDSLGYTPFELLDAVDRQPLGWTHAVSYAPSLAALELLRERSAAGGSTPVQLDALVVAPAMDAACVAPWGLEPFSVDDRTLREFAAPWGERARVLAGGAATAEALGASTALLHLISHGHFEPSRELSAAVLLAGPEGQGCEPWWSEDAASASPAQLVVMTACGAWRGPRRRGDDGRASFAGQWIAAGAHAVVLAQVELELERALELSGELHGALARGESAAEALRQARRALATSPDALAAQHLVTHVFGNGAARIAMDATRAARGSSDTRSQGRMGWFAAGGLLLLGAGALLARARSARRARA